MAETQHRKLAAIMFTDIVGYTALMSRDERLALKVLDRNRGLLKPLISQANGEWLKEIGDGTPSAFASAVAAVPCAPDVQPTLPGDQELAPGPGRPLGAVGCRGGVVLGDLGLGDLGFGDLLVGCLCMEGFPLFFRDVLGTWRCPL